MTKDDAGAVGDIAARSARSPASVLTPDVDPTLTATAGEHGEPAPDISRTKATIQKPSSRSISITIIAVLASLYTLYFAREFLIPIVFAILLNFLLSPVLRALARIRIPPPAGAAIIVLILLGAIGVGAYSLTGPVQTVAAAAPQTLSKASAKVRRLVLTPLQQATNQMERATSTLKSDTAGHAQAQIVVTNSPTIGSRILGTTQVFVAAVLEIVILLYFLLAGGDLFLQKFIKVLPHSGDKRKAVEIARATEAAVSAYLSTAFIVNIAEGTVVALLLWALGMPNPVLWGVMVAAVEFVPYLGALAGVIILALAGLTTFDNVAHALLVPGSFLAVNLIQANLVTPMLLGHRLTLNPVAIFVGLTFFFWIWGVAGAFLAVPLLATLKIFCDNIQSLAALGEFLGERDTRERRHTIREPATPVSL